MRFAVLRFENGAISAWKETLFFNDDSRVIVTHLSTVTQHTRTHKRRRPFISVINVKSKRSIRLLVTYDQPDDNIVRLPSPIFSSFSYFCIFLALLRAECTRTVVTAAPWRLNPRAFDIRLSAEIQTHRELLDQTRYRGEKLINYTL